MCFTAKASAEVKKNTQQSQRQFQEIIGKILAKHTTSEKEHHRPSQSFGHRKRTPTNRTGENPNPRNSENQTLIFCCCHRRRRRRCLWTEQCKNKKRGEKKLTTTLLKERKTRTHQRHWLSTTVTIAFIIAF